LFGTRLWAFWTIGVAFETMIAKNKKFSILMQIRSFKKTIAGGFGKRIGYCI
jgi:hypothetical protein